MRPPSSGAAGSRLNTASTPFTTASQPIEAVARPGAPAALRARAATPHRAVRATLTIGPAAAMRHSARGVGASSLRRATPPRIHKSMPSTPTPYRRAATAWPISWARTVAKKAAVVTAPTVQYTHESCPGWATGRLLVAIVSVRSSPMPSRLQCTPTGTPRILPILNVPAMAGGYRAELGSVGATCAH